MAGRLRDYEVRLIIQAMRRAEEALRHSALGDAERVECSLSRGALAECREWIERAATTAIDLEHAS